MTGFVGVSLKQKVALLGGGLIALLVVQAAAPVGAGIRWVVAAVGCVAGGALTVSIVRRIAVATKQLVDRTAAIEHAAMSGSIAASRPWPRAISRCDSRPERKPVTEFAGDEFGQIHRGVESFRDAMVASYTSYNSTVDTLSRLVSQLSETAGSVDGAAHNVSSHTAEAGRATNEIATAIADVAQGAERQVQMIEAVRLAVEEVTAAVASSC